MAIQIEKLKAQGYRLTPQRLIILQILEEARMHLSPAEVYNAARERIPGITEATVYRTLEFLSREGLAWVTSNPDGHLIYEESSHCHHHLVCRGCGRTVEVDDHYLQDLYRRFQKDTGYRVDSSHLLFFGLCPSCAAAKA